MICCDQCEEWYHGSCVGISVNQGKRMEREGKEYICPVCVEKEKQAREQRELNRCVCVRGCVEGKVPLLIHSSLSLPLGLLESGVGM